MQSIRTFRGLALMLAVSCGALVGCGSNEQQYSDTEIVKQTPTQQVRQWLEGVAKTGQLDSGSETVKGTIEEMRAAGVEAATVDSLLQDANQLTSMKSPQQIRAQAQKMLSKLPTDPPATSS